MDNRLKNDVPAQSTLYTEEADPILTVQEVAEMLRVPVSWVYERVRRKGSERLPHFKLGKYVRFRASAVRDWLQHRSEA